MSRWASFAPSRSSFWEAQGNREHTPSALSARWSMRSLLPAGPPPQGSMRHIQLRRGNRLVADFDIYDLLRRGDKSHDVQLLPGDVIYIPPAGPQVAIMGSVNEPGIYELKGETTIAAALEATPAGSPIWRKRIAFCWSDREPQKTSGSMTSPGCIGTRSACSEMGICCGYSLSRRSLRTP